MIRAAALLATLLTALPLAAPCGSQQTAVSSSEWWTEVEEIDEQLKRHKWKPARKQARKLAEKVARRSWYGRDLGKVLAELALYQAVAEANLGLEREALWHWHMASNLDLAMRRRDLKPYGDAAKLLLEFPLRRRGEVPLPFAARPPPPGSRVERPELPDIEAFPVFNNTGAALEGSGDCRVELIVDRAGKLHQPVVVSDHLNPVILFHVLDKLPGLPPFQPLRYDGEPSDTVLLLTVRFHVIRW